MEDESSYRYTAFISYRHVEPDRGWARWVHGKLETYHVPARIVARGSSARIGRVFRDEDELAASSELKADIEEALTQSKFLIVICSPRTPESMWVNKEVARFREMGRHDRILAVLIEGEPRDAFPKALREIRRTVTDARGLTSEQIEEVEPLAADVRHGGREGKRLARLRLMAVILGVRFDDLRQRDHERSVRKLTAVGMVLAIVAIAMAGLAVVAGWQWKKARTAEAAARKDADIANRRIRDVREILTTFMFDLDDALAELPGATPARRMLAETSLTHLDQVMQDVGDDPRLLRDVSQAYERVGDILGSPNGANESDTAGAMKSYAKARELIERRAKADPADEMLPRDRLEIGQKIGDVQLQVLNQPEDALREYQLTTPMARAAADAHPEDIESRRELGVTYLKVGDAQLGLGQIDQAGDSYGHALNTFEALVASAPDRQQPRQDLASVYDRLGGLQSRMKQGELACDSFLKASRTYESLLAADKSNVILRRAVAASYLRLGEAQLQIKKIDDALANAGKAADLFESLAHEDPSNGKALRDLTSAYESLGTARSVAGKVPEMVDAYQHMTETAGKLVALDPADLAAREMQLAVLNKLGMAQILAMKNDAAVATFRKKVDLVKSLSAEHPDNVAVKIGVANALASLGEVLGQTGHFDEAATQFRNSAATFAAADNSPNAAADRNAWVELLRVGAMESALGKKADLSPADRAGHWKAAAAAFDESLQRVKKLKDAGRLAKGEEEAIAAITTQINLCQAEADKLASQ